MYNQDVLQTIMVIIVFGLILNVRLKAVHQQAQVIRQSSNADYICRGVLLQLQVVVRLRDHVQMPKCKLHALLT